MRRLVRFWFSTTGRVDRTTHLRHVTPEGYWQLLSDALIHRIHRRVLNHIKREAELDTERSAS